MKVYSILFVLGLFICLLGSCNREIKTQSMLSSSSSTREKRELPQEQPHHSVEKQTTQPTPTPLATPEQKELAPSTFEVTKAPLENPKTEGLAVNLAPAPTPSIERSASPISAKMPAKVWNEPEKKYVQELVHQFETRPEPPRKPEGWEWLGKKLPVSRFIQEGGEILDLQDYEGKKNVLLIILRGFAGSICPVCSSQTFALSKNIHRFQEKETQVIVIYPGKAETVPHFLESLANLDPDFKPPFPMVMDVELSFIHRFNLESKLAKPTSILIDKSGLVRYAYIGKNAMDRPSIPVLLREIEKMNSSRKT